MGLSRSSSGTVARDLLHILSLDDIILLRKIIFTWKAVNGLQPQNIGDKLVPIQHNHYTRFRSNNNFTIAFSKSTFGQKSFAVWGPSFWATLPSTAKDCTSISCLKRCFFNDIVNRT
jgi:hypothetical protein